VSATGAGGSEWPSTVGGATELEELLSRPPRELARELGRLRGDLVVLGAGGRLGLSLATMARRALDEAGSRRAVIAVSRFGGAPAREALEASGVRTIAADLLDPAQVAALPEAGAAVFMVGAGRRGSGVDARTWAVNALLPGLVAGRYAGAPTVVFSSDVVYPAVPVDGEGANEETPPEPAGEYALSVLARERVFDSFSREHGTPSVLLRCGHVAELRRGVVADVASRVLAGEPIELSAGPLDVIWQGDAVAAALRSIALGQSPPRVLNLTGAERVSLRELAGWFGQAFGCEPVLAGDERASAPLGDGARALALFGPPRVTLQRLVDWTARWLAAGGEVE